MLDIQRGDFDAARRVAAEALALTNGDAETDTGYFAEGLATRVSFRVGDPVRASRRESEYFDGLRVRLGQAPSYEASTLQDPCEREIASARVSAQAGDGRRLATVLQSCGTRWLLRPEMLLGLLPLVKQGRPELATALRWWSGNDREYQPFSAGLHAAFKRDVLRMVDDTESAELWARIAAAYAAPLQDPTRRTAPVLWSMQ